MVCMFDLDQHDRQHGNLARHAGPLLGLLQDPKTLDVVVNADGAIWVNTLGLGFTTKACFPPALPNSC